MNRRTFIKKTAGAIAAVVVAPAAVAKVTMPQFRLMGVDWGANRNCDSFSVEVIAKIHQQISQSVGIPKAYMEQFTEVHTICRRRLP